MTLTAQIVDQQVTGVLRRHERDFARIRPDADPQARRSLAFVFLVAKTVLGLDEEDVMDGIVDGPSDFGVDALYFDSPERGEVHVRVFQAKYRQDTSGTRAFPETEIRKLIEAIRVLFDPMRSVSVNPRLAARLEEVRSFIQEGAIPVVQAVAANNGRKWTTEADRMIEAASSPFHGQVEWRHLGVDELFGLLTVSRPVQERLRLSGLAMVEDFEFRRALTGRMSVSDLVGLMERNGERLLERNIRRYLGLGGNRVNQAIAGTLRAPEERASFYFLNNGITMICSQFRHNALQARDWQVQVQDLQIINGAQTAFTARRVARDVERPDLDAAHVLVRLYETDQGNGDFVSQITLATNSQNPVDLRDLQSNQPEQIRLGESMKALGFRYRRHREATPMKPEDLTTALVAEAVLAVWRQRPHQARFHRRQHFGNLYRTIFTRGLNGAQAILATLMLRHAENRRKRPPAESPDFLPYGSRFAAMLMGTYLLEEMGVKLSDLHHNAFQDARALLEAREQQYLERAEEEIGKALKAYFGERERTLQRLSAVFRRADLVQELFSAK